MISVIIPAYNEETYIAKTLESIPSDVEKIVVCNGCTDNTFSIAKKYADKIFVLNEKSVSKARNFGASQATGSKFVFIDADVELSKDTLDKIKNSKFTIGTTKVKPDNNKLIPNIHMFFKSYIHYLGTCTGLIFIDKELFVSIGGFDESLSIKEDGKLLRLAKKKGNFGVVNSKIINSTRRFQKEGYLKPIFFWISAYTTNKKREYNAVR